MVTTQCDTCITNLGGKTNPVKIMNYVGHNMETNLVTLVTKLSRNFVILLTDEKQIKEVRNLNFFSFFVSSILISQIYSQIPFNALPWFGISKEMWHDLVENLHVHCIPDDGLIP